MASEQPKHHQEPAEIEFALDERREALTSLLKHTLNEFEPDIEASLNEVVATIRPDQVIQIGYLLRDNPATQCNYLRCLSVVDYEERLEVVYHLYSMDKNHQFVLKTNLSPDDPHLPSVTEIWPGADWYEREGHDLFGIIFDGHLDLAPLLLYEGFEGHPGLKSYPINDYREW